MEQNAPRIQQNIHVARHSVKVPPFYENRPALWITTIEAQFHLAHIENKDVSQFYNTIANLPQHVAGRI